MLDSVIAQSHLLAQSRTCTPLSALTFRSTALLLQLSPEVRDLLDRILVPKEEERITIPEIEAHPWCVCCVPGPHIAPLHFAETRP